MLVEEMHDDWPHSDMMAKWILDASLAAGDLTEEEPKGFNNSDWNDPRMIHYCLVGRCPFKRKSPAQAKATAKEIARLSFCRGMGISLFYRWKNIERSNAYVMRAMGPARHLDKCSSGPFFKEEL